MEVVIVCVIEYEIIMAQKHVGLPFMAKSPKRLAHDTIDTGARHVGLVHDSKDTDPKKW